MLAGDKRISLAITEPSGGSDVAQIKTRARRDGDDFVVDGSKMFITGGMRADYFTTAVRTGGDGLGGISLLLIEADRPGVSRTKLKKQGWWASDTAAVYFDSVRVPAENLIGGENQGFLGIMHNFNGERLGMAAGACASARVCLEEAVKWAQQRETFGKRLADHQVIRHKIAEMLRQINATTRLSRNVRLARDERREARGRSRAAQGAGDADAGILRPRGDADSGRQRVTCAAAASSASIAKCASTPSAAAPRKSCAISRQGRSGFSGRIALVWGMTVAATRTQRHAVTRAAILDAARLVATRDGAKEFSLRAVAAEAGFAPAALYSYFKNKDELLLALAADDLSGLARAMRRVRKGHGKQAGRGGQCGALAFAKDRNDHCGVCCVAGAGWIERRGALV